MDSKLFLGNMDANGLYIGKDTGTNPEMSPLYLRRMILFQLLQWGKIVMSDSQVLTDPRILQLTSMKKKERDLENRYHLPVPEDWQLGFEKLFTQGQIIIASRQEQENLHSVWEGMHERDNGNVPNLPQYDYFANFMCERGYVRDLYSVGDAAGLFKQHLLAGISDDTEQSELPADLDPKAKESLTEIIYKRDSVLFAELLERMNQLRKKGLINSKQYEQIYTFIHGCYSVNIPILTDSYTQSKVQEVPLYLDFGTGDFQEEPAVASDVKEKLQSTWALNPAVLDLLSIDGFLEVKQAVQEDINHPLMGQFKAGTLTTEGWMVFPYFWNGFIRNLEGAIRNALLRDQISTAERLNPVTYTTKQTVLKDMGMEIVKTAASFTIMGNVTGLLDTLNSFKNIGIALSNQRSRESLQRKHQALVQLTDRDAQIIAKIGKSSQG